MDILLVFVEFAAVGFALIAGIFLVRNNAQAQADHMRQTYELFFPGTMGHEQVLSFIRSLSGLPKPRFLQPTYAVSLSGTRMRKASGTFCTRRAR